MTSDLGELVHEGTAAKDCPVFDVGLTCDAGVAYKDAMVADCTVMGDMDIRHYESIVTDLGHAFAAGLGTTVDGSALTDSDTVTDFDIGGLTVEFQVLRNSSYYSTREDFAVLAECNVFIYYSIRMNLAAVTDGNVIINECKRADFYIVAKFCLRADECKRMDFINFVLLFNL